jgi:hypothetical protein
MVSLLLGLCLAKIATCKLNVPTVARLTLVRLVDVLPRDLKNIFFSFPLEIILSLKNLHDAF